jgi:integrase
MGLYKLCGHSGRARDRCEHPWWGSYHYGGRLYRTSLPKWANRKIDTKAKAQLALEEMRRAVRAGKFDRREPNVASEGPLTFRRFAQIYADRHVKAKGLSLAADIDCRLRPLLQQFGDRLLADIRTADVEDFVASLKKPRQNGATLAPASINRTVTLLRHMFNWAIGREYIERTPFRRGTEKLIQLEQEDNKRRRRVSPDEEAKLLAAAPPQLRSMIVVALDTGTRRGEMLALRFADLDLDRGLIALRGVTTKSGKTRHVPISTLRLRAVFEWLRIDGEGKEKPAEALIFADEEGKPIVTFRRAWVTTVLKAHGVKTTWVKTPAQEGEKGVEDSPYEGPLDRPQPIA